MIGLTNFRPRFVKQYSNIRKIIEKSVRNYCRDVKKRRFPYNQNVYESWNLLNEWKFNSYRKSTKRKK